MNGTDHSTSAFTAIVYTFWLVYGFISNTFGCCLRQFINLTHNVKNIWCSVLFIACTSFDTSTDGI